MLIQSVHAAPLLTSLEQLEWSNRIIVIKPAQNPSLQKEIAQLKQRNAEIDDRDIIWFTLSDKTLVSNYPGKIAAQLQQQLLSLLPKSQAQVVLIGKDGGIKDKNNELNLSRIFSLIDQMPMRIAEMNENR